MKSKYYCQLCKASYESDESFHAHLISPRHRLQREAYDRNASVYTEYFSGKFARQFLEVLKSFGTSVIGVNTVYQAHLSNSAHVRLTSTKWVTLTEFSEWLNQNFRGKYAVVKNSDTTDTEIQFLEDSPDQGFHQMCQTHGQCAASTNFPLTSHTQGPPLKRKSENNENTPFKKAKHAEMDKSMRDTTTTTSKSMLDDPFNVSHLVKEAFSSREDASSKNTVKPKPVWNLSRSRITFSLNKNSNSVMFKHHELESETQTNNNSSEANIQGSSDVLGHGCEKTSQQLWKPRSKLVSLRRSALQELREEREQERDCENRRQNWLYPGIVVKVITKRLGRKFFAKEALVLEVKHLYTALLQFLESGTRMYADQSHVKTVVPSLGERVLIVNGGYRGYCGILKNISDAQGDHECCSHNFGTCAVQIDTGLLRGRLIGKINQEDVAKLKKR